MWPGGGAINAISFDEFASKVDYIDKLVPGSTVLSASDYYAKPAFYNTEAGHAKFETTDGDVVEVYEGEVGFTCNMVGVGNYMVDFTGVDLTKISRTEYNQGGTYATGRIGKTNPDAWDVRTKAQKAAMIQNTLFLQLVEYCAAGSGKTITVPKGEYYFAIGHSVPYPGSSQKMSAGSVIYPVNNVNVMGRGIGPYNNAISMAIKNSDTSVIDAATPRVSGLNATIFKPYTNAAFSSTASPHMFFYNNYSMSGFMTDEEAKAAGLDGIFLRNVKYYNFIIDSEDAVGSSYSSAGKGFMYNVFENVQWDTVVVKNTDGTGFGVDSPKGRNNIINNCLAINNGKKATPADGNEYPGASGFGIGIGYGDDEYFTIKNSVAYGNAKFGFFFEHQNRFQNPKNEKYPYDATRGAGNGTLDKSAIDTGIVRNAFVVTNSLGADNMYNYGGMRAHDMVVTNSASLAGCTGVLAEGTYYSKTTCTQSNVYYSGDSRRVSVDIDVDAVFSDVNDSSQWYYEPVKWAVENGVVYGVGQGTFGVGQQMHRKDALVIIWRLMGSPGDVVTRANNNQSTTAPRRQHIETCFADVGEEMYVDDKGGENMTYFAGAVKWAYHDRYNPASNTEAKGRIILGKKGCSSDTAKDGIFGAEDIVTRAEFVTMLWRLAGEPYSNNMTNEFTDVSESDYYYKAVLWASRVGITKGVGNNKFAPTADCTREQVVTFLYRFYQKYGKMNI